MKNKIISIALLTMFTFGQVQAEEWLTDEEYYAHLYVMFCEGEKSPHKTKACEAIFTKMLEYAITNKTGKIRERVKKAKDILD